MAFVNCEPPCDRAKAESEPPTGLSTCSAHLANVHPFADDLKFVGGDFYNIFFFSYYMSFPDFYFLLINTF